VQRSKKKNRLPALQRNKKKNKKNARVQKKKEKNKAGCAAALQRNVAKKNEEGWLRLSVATQHNKKK
jgi:hypothetical protein